jgi:uncharacterized protein (TIGR00375 family)
MCYNATMRFLADFHTHSHHSRATSPEMNIAGLARWAQLKGTGVIGTGDFTHPAWFAEMQEKLEPAEPGLFKLKPNYAAEISEVPESCRADMRFLLTVEISTIYKRHERVRKAHSLVFAPGFGDVAAINSALSRIGNIAADGRPILGLDTADLLKIVLDVSPDCMLVPAHAWTPHFAVFGSQSGFDSLDEAFGELAPFVYAIETGLSSDPAMNWRISELDRLALISNSDAHSPRKLGREANVFNTQLSYFAMMDALKTNDLQKFESTIEFFPEEGKYHLDGHRTCGVRLNPLETANLKGLCPKCGKKVIIGVMNRVEQLTKLNSLAGSDPAKEGLTLLSRRPFKSIVPLPEIIAEVEGVVGTSGKKVDAVYFKLLCELGNEFHILLDVPLEDIEKASSPMLALAISRVREGKLIIESGYDGEYGNVKIFEEGER